VLEKGDGQMTSWRDELSLILAGAGAIALLAFGIHQAVRAQDQAPPAKLTPWQAMSIANEQVHGKPISANYMLDESHWLYDVMIAKGKTLNVVEVDANSGKPNKAEVSSPDEESKELAGDLNKALGLPAGDATVKEKYEKGEK
jgi:peptidase YpeB-like protein